MKLYNTLTRQIDEITPLNPPLTTIYTCGPTVYDYAHIGHWFNYVRMDTLIRALQLNDLNTKWVMNITDVGHLTSDADEGEDKLQKGARREGKTAWEVAEFYTRDFLECMQLLNMIQPDEMPKATDHVTEQIDLIKVLENKGYTYVIDDGVYFDTAKFQHYADFAQLDLEEQQAGARVAINKQKRNSSDFALWKFTPRDQTRDMEWDSPWGKGFPGWHIECSAMSMKYLGETLDIHTGGIDHIPVHHTNEIAQSEAATGKPFANHWMHGNHVMVEGQKISKSLGNGIRLQQIMERGFSPETVRLHVLESHYRSQSKFSWASLEAADNRLKVYKAFADLLWELPDTGSSTELLDDYTSSIKKALLSDLDTPQALTLLSELESKWLSVLSTSDKTSFRKFLQFIDVALGLKLADTRDITDAQYDLIKQRENARKNEEWETSDRLRDQLSEQGIGLRDTETGAIWFRL